VLLLGSAAAPDAFGNSPAACQVDKLMLKAPTGMNELPAVQGEVVDAGVLPESSIEGCRCWAPQLCQGPLQNLVHCSRQ
jgi:hypothetical protein